MSASLASLRAIDLDELVAVAALQTRVDRKYIVAADRLDAIVGELDPDTRILEMNDARAFAYESVYFDTPDLVGYLGAARRRRRRFKVRTRSYLESARCYLEVKTPGARSATVKDRLEHEIAERTSLGSDREEYARETLGAARVADADPHDLVPVLRTNYDRATLFVPSSNSRATIDTGLTWRLETGSALTLPHLAIVETKSGSTPSDVDRALWRHGIRPSSLSKYGTGLAALVPELPSTKWERVLRTHFRPALTPSSTITPKDTP